MIGTSSPKAGAVARRSARDLLAGHRDRAAGRAPPSASSTRPRRAAQASSRFGAADSLVNPWELRPAGRGRAAVRGQRGAAEPARGRTGRDAVHGAGSPRTGRPAARRARRTRAARSGRRYGHRPFTLAEIRQLFGEARASWRGRPARRAVDFYAATRTLGVARGIGEFTRYGLQRRNGLAFAAVPLDRVEVREQARGAAGRRSRGLGLAVPRAATPRRRSARPSRRFERRSPRATPATAARWRWPAMLAALTTLEQAVGRSGRTQGTRRRYAARPPRGDFLAEFTRQDESPELRVAVGHRVLRDPAAVSRRCPSRSMRQILLPMDPPVPGDRPSRTGGGATPRWCRASGAARCRRCSPTCWSGGPGPPSDERGQPEFRGVPTFRLGIPVPAADLHAFARRASWTRQAWTCACGRAWR